MQSRLARWSLGGAAVLIVAWCAAMADAEPISLVVGSRPPSESASVTVTVTAAGFLEASDSSPISGDILLDLLPSAVAPHTARITEMRLVVDESVSLRLLGGVVQATTQPGEVRMDLIEPGQAGLLSGNQFDQLGNLVAVEGSVSVSVQNDPLELGTTGPTEVDLMNVGLTRVGRTVTLQNSLSVAVEVPVDTGLLGVVPLTIHVTGDVLASGAIPVGLAEWQPDAGAPGDRTQWTTSTNWQRNEVQDIGPLEGDQVLFPPLSSGPAIVTLEGAQAVAETTVAGQYSLTGGSLHLQQPSLEVQAQGVLVMEADLVATAEITKQGQGDLIIQGESTPVRVGQGRLGGQGRLQSLTVEQGATLLGLFNSELLQRPLRVAETATLEGDLHVVTTWPGSQAVYSDPTIRGQRHTAILLEAHSIAADLTGVRYETDELSPEITQGEERVFRLHEGEGLFRSVLVGTESVRAENYLAVHGDANGDGAVDFGDFLRVSATFGGPGDWTHGDFNASGAVEFADFLQLSANFGHAAAATVSVPEPGSCYLVLAALLLLSRRLLGFHPPRGASPMSSTI